MIFFKNFFAFFCCGCSFFSSPTTMMPNTLSSVSSNQANILMPHSSVNILATTFPPASSTAFGAILCQQPAQSTQTKTTPAAATTTTTTTTKMSVERQEAIVSYQFQRNDRQYLLHDVVKNDPFCITLTSVGGNNSNSSSCLMNESTTLTCTLIYNDFDVAYANGAELRPVKTISGGSPFQWTVLEKSAHRVVIRFRIDGALSSQHKDVHQLDGHFRIAIVFVSNSGDETRVFSHPIRGSSLLCRSFADTHAQTHT